MALPGGFSRAGCRGLDRRRRVVADDPAKVLHPPERKELLRGGVRLYELKRSAKEEDDDKGIGGSSDASLRAKTFAVDRSCIFVGSFNFDPRSARLSTEIGLELERLQVTCDDLPRSRASARMEPPTGWALTRVAAIVVKM